MFQLSAGSAVESFLNEISLWLHVPTCPDIELCLVHIELEVTPAFGSSSP